MKKVFWIFLFVSMQAQATDYLCKNPEVPRLDYVIRELDAKSYDFQVQKNTTDSFSSRSRWGRDVETEVIFQETLKGSMSNLGLKLKGKRTVLDLSHPEHVTYKYVSQDSNGQFTYKTYVLNCEVH